MRHFFAGRWKARTWREGTHLGERGPPPGHYGGHFHAIPGGGCGVVARESRGPGFARTCGEEGAARDNEGRAVPTASRGRGASRQGAPRAWCASLRRPPGGAGEGLPAERRLLPSGGGNVGARAWGPPGAGWLRRSGRASPPRALPMAWCCSGLHHVGGCEERPGRARGAGSRGPRDWGGVSEGPHPSLRLRLPGPRLRTGRGSWLLGSSSVNTPHTRGISGHCGNLPAPASGPPGHVPLASCATSQPSKILTIHRSLLLCGVDTTTRESKFIYICRWRTMDQPEN
ncbi:collagen alpha-2(I) chain-like [Choloepus didactylus]|uniref:collagen alpha-2(I) chain-like n=1 Tax=Choloepus didactylus TaxID=27675 RepID=UPI00189F3D0E|nr:collagen alpha-2(I) chain-like [Choloepus didactylus]